MINYYTYVIPPPPKPHQKRNQNKQKIKLKLAWMTFIWYTFVVFFSLMGLGNQVVCLLAVSIYVHDLQSGGKTSFILAYNKSETGIPIKIRPFILLMSANSR